MKINIIALITFLLLLTTICSCYAQDDYSKTSPVVQGFDPTGLLIFSSYVNATDVYNSAFTYGTPTSITGSQYGRTGCVIAVGWAASSPTVVAGAPISFQVTNTYGGYLIFTGSELF